MDYLLEKVLKAKFWFSTAVTVRAANCGQPPLGRETWCSQDALEHVCNIKVLRRRHRMWHRRLSNKSMRCHQSSEPTIRRYQVSIIPLNVSSNTE